MEGLDLFATKGLEYILVIGYLLLLVGCRRMVGPRMSESQPSETGAGPAAPPSFELRDGFRFHQGHAWARAAGDGLMRLGIDDFAQKLLGRSTGVVLPRIGARLAEGEPGWKIRVGGRTLSMLSPVEGEVVRWNDAAIRSPGLLNREPYEGGWLLEVKVRSPAAATRNLLSGRLARAWLDAVSERLAHLSSTDSATASFEPASPGEGLARTLSPDGWDRLVREFFLTQEGTDGELYDAREQAEEGRDQYTPFV